MARPSKDKALKRLRKALDGFLKLKEIDFDSPEFQKWHRGTQIAITKTFEDKSHLQEFKRSITTSYQEDSPKPAASLLESLIEEIEEYWEDEGQTPASSVVQENERASTNEVFVIHGRDNEAKETVARFLTRLDLTPVILHEQSNQGRTIIEKFEQHAQVGFAVALLTPDDVGALQENSNDLKPRARQNVIFEFGYFIGRLGRNRVCALTKGDVEIPSDYDGVVYIPLDDRAWKMDLVKELQSARYNVDANKAL